MNMTDYLFQYVVLYMILGTIWAWYAQSVFYKLKHLYHIMSLRELPSIAINCIIFPIGMLFNIAIYITKVVWMEGDLEKTKITFIIDTLALNKKNKIGNK